MYNKIIKQIKESSPEMREKFERQEKVVEATTEIIETLKGADNEGSRAPWWSIIDPKQLFELDHHKVASMVTGPFYCRKDAEEFLQRTKYNFSKHARVFCHSGCYSKKYENLCRALKI